MTGKGYTNRVCANMAIQGLIPMDAELLQPSDDHVFKLLLTRPGVKPASIFARLDMHQRLWFGIQWGKSVRYCIDSTQNCGKIIVKYTVPGYGLKQKRHYSTRGGIMQMKLREITKQNIVKTTGLPIMDLLEKSPIKDSRLKRLRRQEHPGDVDLLVRGNPQLTMGYVTPITTVDSYFEKKMKKSGGHE